MRRAPSWRAALAIGAIGVVAATVTPLAALKYVGTNVRRVPWFAVEIKSGAAFASPSDELGWQWTSSGYWLGTTQSSTAVLKPILRKGWGPSGDSVLARAESVAVPRWSAIRDNSPRAVGAEAGDSLLGGDLVVETAAGWPLYSVKQTGASTPQLARRVADQSAPSWLDVSGTWLFPTNDAIRFLPARLACNALFFAGLLFAGWAALDWGRWALRRKRGQCSACGYNRSGLLPDAPCPECGQVELTAFGSGTPARQSQGACVHTGTPLHSGHGADSLVRPRRS